jgi:XamI restriction endonuclease
MAVNSDKPSQWKTDIARSVDFYNNWFLRFAPRVYRDTRVETTKQVESALKKTANLTSIAPVVLSQDPSVLPILRMSTAPPIARDRLIGLAGVAPNLVRSMELGQQIPPRMNKAKIYLELEKMGNIILRLADKDIFSWLESRKKPTRGEVHRAATIVADRLCGTVSDPIIRNAQEQRQLAAIKRWLDKRGYLQIKSGNHSKFNEMNQGTYAFRLNVPIRLKETATRVNIPVDAVVMPLQSQPGDLPLLIEAKSAGDYTNTNKRRKEEAIKISQLKANYGDSVRFVLFLCGYFDSGYLGYEAAEGIDWVWEHRIDDLAKFGV